MLSERNLSATNDHLENKQHNPIHVSLRKALLRSMELVLGRCVRLQPKTNIEVVIVKMVWEFEGGGTKEKSFRCSFTLPSH